MNFNGWFKCLLSRLLKDLSDGAVTTDSGSESGYTLPLQTKLIQISWFLILFCTVCHSVYEFISTFWSYLINFQLEMGVTS